MHARVTTLSIDPSKTGEATQIYQNSILPALQAQQGFKGAYLLVNPTTGKGVSLTLWANEADGQAYESSGSYREQVAKAAALFTAPPTLDTYDVGVQG